MPAGHRPRRRFGQNFLHDQFVIHQIVQAVRPRPGEPLVEIGPGLGALTGPLLQAAGELTVIELDRDLAASLAARLHQDDAASSPLRVLQQDALQTDFSTLRDSPDKRLRLIGNLPYNIATPLLFRLFEQAEHIADMTFMLQLEVARRLAARPGSGGGDYGRLSVMVQYYCQVELLFTVGPGAFRPSPKVQSAVVRLTPYHEQQPVTVSDPQRLAAVVAQAFSQRRKTLRNSLKNLLSSAQISAAGVDPGARPEALSLVDFARLSERTNAPTRPRDRNRKPDMSENNPLRQLNNAGQSVWYDNIHRGMLGAELGAMIEHDDLRGITSNPAIFEKAIAAGNDYDAALATLLREQPDADPRSLFFSLAISDIQAAADQLAATYQSSDGVDGMVSLEVSPDLADDAAATIAEARELHQRLARPNVMIKVPATEAGLEAIEQLTADGININVTLLFSVARYRAVAEAYLRGLERRLQEDLPVAGIGSVASFFVSRVDAALDPLLAEKNPSLAGKIAIANAKSAYRSFQELFGGERWQRLAAAGAKPQRLLWASTSTKNPDYPELLYVESLIGPDTVNTLPPATYQAFRERGRVAETLPQDLDNAQQQIAELAASGIDLSTISDRLEQQGVQAFVDAFNNLLTVIENRSATLAA